MAGARGEAATPPRPLERKTVMNEMIERVARAIYFRGDDQGDNAWNYCQSTNRDVAREQARAAILAMREPTPEMCVVGRNTFRHYCLRHMDGSPAVYSDMIGSALADGA